MADGLSAEVTWNGSQKKAITDSFSHTPQSTDDVTVTAAVTLYAGEGDSREQLYEYTGDEAATATITVYDRMQIAKITSTKYYALAGTNEFNLEALVVKPDDISAEYTWYMNGEPDESSKTNTITFNPQKDANIYNVSVSVTLKDKENKVLDTISSSIKDENGKNKDIQIIVYEIGDVSCGLSSPTSYTYVGNPLQLEATDIKIQQTPQASDNVPELPYKIFWRNGDKKIDNAEGPTYQYTPTREGQENITAEIVIYSPEGNTDEPEVWKNENFTELKTIYILKDPTKAVTGDIIKTQIEGPNEDPQNIIAYKGQTDNNQPIKFNYSINSPNADYAWTYRWVLLNSKMETVSNAQIDVTDDLKKGSNVSVSNANLEAGTYYVKVYAQAINPDRDLTEEKTWGDEIPCVLEHPITIYAKPADPQEQNLHSEENDTSHVYSIYVGDTFDANNLFLLNETTGYTINSDSYGWKKELAIDNGSLQKDLTYTPSVEGEYKLRLLIKNEAPTGTWYTNDPSGKGIEYTLNVYKYPTCNSSAIVSTLFDEGDDILHVKSGEEVKFQVTPKDGESEKWNIYSTVSGEDGKNEFKKDTSIREWTFLGTNDTDSYVDSVEYTIGIHISNDIEHLMKNSEIFTDTITKKIVVWKDIIPTVNTKNTGNTTTTLNTESKVYEIETREGDGDIDLVLDLVGGNPDKWKVTPNINERTPNQDNRTYKYTISTDALKADNQNPKTYTYTLEANYVDGMTKDNKDYQYKKTFSIKVWPKPKMSVSDFALTDANEHKVGFTGDTSNDNIIDYGDIACYENDEIVLKVQPTGGDTNGTWKYQKPGGDKTDLPSNKTITITKENYENFVGTTQFFNYLSEEKEGKEVYSINIKSITRYSQPEINMGLPNVDKTSNTDWNDAEKKNSSNPVPVDLYGGVLPDGSEHVAKFDFSPKANQGGNMNGWTYDWKYETKNGNTIEQPSEGSSPTHGYSASEGNFNSNYEDRILTVHITNKIPQQGAQEADNVGLEITKQYVVRVWHEAELPAPYTLTDTNNTGNNVKDTKAIREGNILEVKVDPIRYGYCPEDGEQHYYYEWKGLGTSNNTNTTNWSPTMTNTDDGNKPGSSKTTYSLDVYNQGPRGTKWATSSFTETPVTIYNRPVTPSSLVIKGNGTSGTLIITYGGINDNALIGRGDYVLNFGYVDENGAEKVLAQEVRQAEEGNVRFTTGYDKNRMKGAYAYTYWWDGNNLITSGKVSMDQDGKTYSSDESFDDSQYNLSQDTKELIKQMTRSGIGDYTTIKAVASDDGPESMTRVYDMSGKIVSTSTDGLAPGIYVLRYRQDGSMKSKKLFIK